MAQGVISGKPTKPDPYLPTLVASALGVLPSECIMIGDSDVDLRTARNAGMMHVGVSWGYCSEKFLRASGAELVVNSPPELLQVIQEKFI